MGDAEALPAEQQVAHVIEHIVHAKMTDPSKGSIWERVARLGGQRGNDTNAGTGYAETSYFVRVPPDNADALAEGLDILLGWATPTTLTAEDIDRERSAVIEEGRGTSTVMRDFFDAQRRTWFPGHPVFGFRQDPPGSLSASPETIRSVYRSFYVPSNMAIIIVGDVDPERVAEHVEALFSNIESVEPAPNRAAIADVDLKGGHYVKLGGADQRETRLQLSFKYKRAEPGDRTRAEEIAIQAIIAKLFDGALENVVQRYSAPIRGGGVSVADQSNPASPFGTDIFLMNLALKRGEAAAGLSQALTILSTVEREGFSEEHIERVRSEIVRNFQVVEPSVDRLSADLASLFLYGRRDPGSAEVRSAMLGVSSKDVNAMLASWLDAKNRDIILSYPEQDGDLVPSTDQLTRFEAEARTAPPAKLLPGPVRTPDLGAMPAIERRDAPEPVLEDGGFHRWMLPRSQATLLVQRTSGDVQLAILRRGGGSRFREKDVDAALFAGRLVAASGLGNLSKFELGRFLKSRGMSVRPVVYEGREGVLASGPADDWMMVIRLAHAQITRPQCNPDAFAELAQPPFGVRAERQPDETAIGPEEFSARIAKELTPPVAETSAKPALKRVCQMIETIFDDTRHMTIVVEGNVDEAEVYAAVRASLDIPGRPPATARRRPLSVQTQAKRNDYVSVSGDLAKVAIVSQRPALASEPDEQAGFMVRDIVAQRLHHRLRDIEMGTYSVGVNFSMLDVPERSMFSIGFDTSPENVDRLVTATLEELTRLRLDGPSEVELSQSQSAYAEKSRSVAEIAEMWISLGTAAPPLVTRMQITDWIAKNLVTENFRTFALVPRKGPVPEAEQ
ncbi:M16 family metallopeptidase [Sphingopyxis macrogoltabida]|uniref:M16 family metallopeptidase n=1 Tax=Sphingopyxis macrogoltabida TaxID=33050 RepID=UPI001F27262A|nr:insulinase family protein [Sphingopyxis macrogoltabida]